MPKLEGGHLLSWIAVSVGVAQGLADENKAMTGMTEVADRGWVMLGLSGRWSLGGPFRP